MLNRRSSCAVATFGGQLYAVGGVDGNLCHNTAERLDLVRNAWENIAPMSTRRSTHDLVALDDGLYALGGNDGSNSLSTVEIYDTARNKWSMGKSMSLRRTSLAACSLYCNQLRIEPAKVATTKISTTIDESVTILGEKKDY